VPEDLRHGLAEDLAGEQQGAVLLDGGGLEELEKFGLGVALADGRHGLAEGGARVRGLEVVVGEDWRAVGLGDVQVVVFEEVVVRVVC